jgi:hypothetical protein
MKDLKEKLNHESVILKKEQSDYNLELETLPFAPIFVWRIDTP